MYNSTITIKDIDTAREFVNKMAQFMDTEVTLHSGDYSIDGHSIIGIISLDLSKPIDVKLGDNASNDLIDIIKQYA